MTEVLNVWRITDGKSGHENQIDGLIIGLEQYYSIRSFEIPVYAKGVGWGSAFLKRFPPQYALPKPDLVVGAGSRTHSSVWAAGRATGAPTLLLMAPPPFLTGLFSLCIVPEHDGKSGSNIIQTIGALNCVRPGTERRRDRGIFLIGGPSKHHNWSLQTLRVQVETILRSDPLIRWTLTDSRRTPPETSDVLKKMEHDRLRFQSHEDTDSSWLPEQLASAAAVWVTEDSVSMIYEALSSGAAVGILPVPRKRNSAKILKGIETLWAREFVTRFSEETPDAVPSTPPHVLQEADRVAALVKSRLLS